MNYSYIFKYIIVGNGSTGKSCIMDRYINKRFNCDSQTTIGVDFGTQYIDVQNSKGENNKIKIQIWDTAGQELFRSITRSYFRGAAVALVIFDLTNYTSFRDVTKWLDDVRIVNNNNTLIYLIGNKLDKKYERIVPQEEIDVLVETHNLKYFETSAKTGYNIEDIFRNSAVDVLNLIDNSDIDLLDGANGIKTVMGESDQSVTAEYIDISDSRCYCW